MKKLVCLLACCVMLMLVASCDFAPFLVTVHVTDEAGHDRLNPDSEYFIGENITAVYEGQDYPVQKMIPGTKTYVPRFFGLEWRMDRQYGYYLCFGEFDGAESQDVSVTFIWPDGTTDTIHATHARFIGDTWRLNGKRVDAPITLVK